jgi:hypothetical protein
VRTVNWRNGRWRNARHRTRSNGRHDKQRSNNNLQSVLHRTIPFSPADRNPPEISAGVEYPKRGIVASTKVLLQKFLYGSNESGSFWVIFCRLPWPLFAEYSPSQAQMRLKNGQELSAWPEPLRCGSRTSTHKLFSGGTGARTNRNGDRLARWQTGCTKGGAGVTGEMHSRQCRLRSKTRTRMFGA